MLLSLAAGLPVLVPALVPVLGSALGRDSSSDSKPTAPRPWTLLVYGGADNNADGPILEFLDDVRKAIDDDPGIELLLLLDRSEEFSSDATLLGEDFTGARLYRLRKDSAERLSGGTHFPELTLDGEDAELDTADADNVRRFIAWGKAVAPAQRTGLLIYSHASGRTMCPDEESGRDMGIPELSQVLGASESLDFLALELCNMGGIEIGYQWRPAEADEKPRFGAEVLVAIPNAGPPLDWDRAFARIRSSGHAASPLPGPYLDPATMSAADFGRLVIEEGRRGRELAARRHPERAAHEAAACYDLRQAGPVKRAVDALAVALAAGDASEVKGVFSEMRGPGPIGDALNYDGDGPFVDLYDVCRRAADCDALDEAVRARARDVLAAVDAYVVASFGMSAYHGFEAGKHGVFIVLPVNAPGRWRNFRWYTPLAHEEGGKDYGRWAFLGDGATPANGVVENWFELLDAWFDEANAAGGVNGYRY
jgi:clostripain